MAFSTRQASVIGKCLEKYGHLTAESVYGRCKSELPKMSLATVYRNLNYMVDCGLIQRLRMPYGADVYDKTPTVHAHFYCGKCSGVFDMPEISADSVLLSADKHFIATGCDIVVTGFCPECAARKGKE